MHSGELVHRDLKPSNILLNSKCQLKLCDFGLARSLAQSEYEDRSNLFLTDYIATRWYRSPELLLSTLNYTKSVDMWACGCILGELYRRKPIFRSSSITKQLGKIFEIAGKPNLEDLETFYTPLAKQIINSIKFTTKKKKFFPYVSNNATQLILKFLQFKWQERISADEALQHPYVEQFHNPSDEPTAYRIITTPINDNPSSIISEYRDELYY